MPLRPHHMGNSSSSTAAEVESAESIERRRAITAEILSTEATYVRGLNLLVTNFAQPMRAEAEGLGLTSDDVNLFFRGLDAMLFAHRALQRSLSGVVETWTAASVIGDLFLGDFAQQLFPLYADYLVRFEHILERIEQLCQPAKKKGPPSAFASWLDAHTRNLASKVENVASVNLRALLLTPVQRIPRYVLLLADLSRRTPSSHADFQSLVAASCAMQRLADSLNAAKELEDSRRELEALAQRLVDCPLEDLANGTRRLVLEMPVMVTVVRTSDEPAAVGSAGMLPAPTGAGSKRDRRRSAHETASDHGAKLSVGGKKPKPRLSDVSEHGAAAEALDDDATKDRTLYLCDDVLIFAKSTTKMLRRVLRYKDAVFLDDGATGTWTVRGHAEAIAPGTSREGLASEGDSVGIVVVLEKSGEAALSVRMRCEDEPSALRLVRELTYGIALLAEARKRKAKPAAEASAASSESASPGCAIS